MKSHWRKLASWLPISLERKIYHSYFKAQHVQSINQDRGPVSHLTKQELIRATAKSYNLNILVETGTYLGDMVFAMQDCFPQIISIELSEFFYKKAVLRFKGFKNIQLVHGDSGKVLQELAPKLEGPALFWLDGHYSGGKTAKGEKDCPIYDELRGIFASPYLHVILIDDARLFVGKDDYPTIDELKEYVERCKPKSTFRLEKDVIVINTN